MILQIRKLKNLLGSLSLLILLLFTACSKDNNIVVTSKPAKNVTIFFVNDHHGQINNFSKIKAIVDKERAITNVLLVSAGDMFSGNPVVDNHSEKGYPMVDLMNDLEFDIANLGNHEFDYGQQVLKNRMNQANFPFVCANVDMSGVDIPQPHDVYYIEKFGLKFAFLGLLETSGKDGEVIPSTHPLKIMGINFDEPSTVVNKYKDIKSSSGSDVYIALTHIGLLGSSTRLGDNTLAQNFPYFDMIIGGHSHSKAFNTYNNIPVFQSGSYLNYLGKISFKVENKKISNLQWELIDLSTIADYDNQTKSKIDLYNNNPDLYKVIGESVNYMNRSAVGDFYTDALRMAMNVDVSFQNSGGIRADIAKGPITKMNIYSVDPFSNGTVIYQMTVEEIANFLRYSNSGFYYSGIQISKDGSGNVIIKDTNGAVLSASKVLSVGLNDYIPNVHDTFFKNGVVQTKTSAETIIYYLENINSTINYSGGQRYFNY